MTEAEERDAILQRLAASLPHLEASSPRQIAVELVTQGMDIVHPHERYVLIQEAINELRRERD